jgi:hypothetical protein
MQKNLFVKGVYILDKAPLKQRFRASLSSNSSTAYSALTRHILCHLLEKY